MYSLESGLFADPWFRAEGGSKHALLLQAAAEAKAGDADAMFFLGIMYGKGKGVIEDDKEAVKWCGW